MIINKFLFFTIFFSAICVGQNKEKNTIKARLIITSDMGENKKPVDNLKEIKVKEEDKVFFYVKWFNLNKNKYVTSIDILDMDDNYLVQSSKYKFKPKKRTHNTWNSRKFREVIIPEGKIKIRIILDEEVISDKVVNVKYIRN
ncbi:hypothetical protein [Polaribacter porphyrae]|uniref:Uncharacterized protein n=1 Tax=Polaribacter porphyrae TaxID=1137780 RepID=A0A2S7WQ52_9FLAO|nr:hypothetical protein [Polaribacter porphyrae]PQJ79737.1 hypothetical protein BTO18_11375 [Polaribacter porphyrae]